MDECGGAEPLAGLLEFSEYAAYFAGGCVRDDAEGGHAARPHHHPCSMYPVEPLNLFNNEPLNLFMMMIIQCLAVT